MATAKKPASTTLSKNQQSIYDLMNRTLKSWGISTLSGDLRKFVLAGDTGDTLTLALSQTDAYKKRFAGNAARLKAGLPELTPAQYIATEEQYQNVLRSYGLPKGFYDSHADFNAMIGNDISPSELETRAKIAHDQYQSAPAATKALWSQYFGVKGDAIAAILDPTRATQVIQDRANQVAIGGAGAEQGFAVSQKRAQQFLQHGTTLDEARNAYHAIASAFEGDQSIAGRFHDHFTQQDEENDVLLGDADAAHKRAALYGAEQGLFQSHGGTDQNTLSATQTY